MISDASVTNGTRSGRGWAIAGAIGSLGVAAFQLALAAGAPFGRAAWGGQRTDLPVPLRVGSLAAVGVWIVTAGVVAKRGGIDVPVVSERSARRAMVPAIALLGISVVMNAASRSALERSIWTPTAAVLLVSFSMVERSARRTDRDAEEDPARS